MKERPDLLLVTHRVPHPPDKGDRLRTYHLLKYLSRHARVHLASLADEPVSESTWQALKQLCHQVAIAPLGRTRWLRGIQSFVTGRSISEGVFRSQALVETIRNWASATRFHAAMASASSVAEYLRAPALTGAPSVIDLIDVDSQKWRDYAAASWFPQSILYRAEGNRLRRVEKNLGSWSRAQTLVSEAETRLYRSFAPDANAHTVTNGIDLDYYCELPGSVETAALSCVFVGAFDYRPNIDAACWFAKQIWPEIRRQHPEVRFQIVGRNPAASVKRLAAIAGVDVVGSVPDVRPYVRQATVVVAPLRIARGLQNKVLEALAMGKALVASQQALAGFRADIPAVMATSRDEWIGAISRLMNGWAERQQLGERGRAFVERHHHWDHCLEPFLELLQLEEGVNAGMDAAPAMEAAH